MTSHDDIERNEEALLLAVAEHREQRCRELLEGARERAAATMHRAYRLHRARLHAAVEQARTKARDAEAATRAEIGTRRRVRRQRMDTALLEIAWEPLKDALVARWRDPVSRTAWIRALLDIAIEHLPGPPWDISHPPGWDPCEVARTPLHEPAMLDPATHRFVATEDIVAGLRIEAEHARLDGTLEGLLVDREEVAASLLAEFARARAEETRT